MRPLFLFAIYGVAFAGVTLVRATADANNPAHELAQKFAIGDQLKTNADAMPAQPQPKPAKPVLAAPQPSAAVPKVQTRAQPPAATAPSVAAPVTKAAPKLAQAKPRPPAPGPDYERDMLDAARAEAEARQNSQSRHSESEQAKTPPAAVTVPAPAAAPSPVAPPPAPAAAASPSAASAPTQAAATPTQAPSAPAAAPQIRIEAKVNVPAPSAPVILARPEGAPRATILAVLTQPTRDARSITPPDPIICLADICYVSAGPDNSAKLISRSDALSTRNTVTTGAGSCKGRNRCAFRDVSMKPGDEIQIIDLGIAGHDRREGADTEPDKTCHMDEEYLVCERPVTAPDYRIWVVPETIAASAGSAAIEAALADDLPEEDVAQAGDK